MPANRDKCLAQGLYHFFWHDSRRRMGGGLAVAGALKVIAEVELFIGSGPNRQSTPIGAILTM